MNCSNGISTSGAARVAALLIATSGLLACGDSDSAKSAAESATDAAKETMSKVAETTNDVVSNTADAAAAMASDAGDAAKGAVDKAADMATDAADTVTDAAKGAADSAADAAKDMMGHAKDTANATAASVATAAGGMADAAKSAVTGGGDPVCEATVTVGDTLAYDVTAITTQASCGSFSLTLKHTGNLAANVMGHNWVLVPKGTAQEIASAGLAAGADAGYIPADGRIIAKTKVIGGGQSDTITFPVNMGAGEYTYVCTFPGHWVAMRGTLTVI